MASTLEQCKNIIEYCRDLFKNKLIDYGTSWRILRPSSVTDQLWIKARRIRAIQEKQTQKIEDTIIDEFMGLVNYSVIALIQINLKEDKFLLSEEMALEKYDEETKDILILLGNKNHDYDEAWRDMRIESITDIILMKLLRIKQIENHQGKVFISENIPNHYRDIVNYALFCLILLNFSKKNTC